jgi:hypothetical protein
MLIYNVTTKVDHSIHEPWVEWMKAKHIDDVMKSGCFTDFKFVRLLDTDESDGPTYAVQFFAESKADYNRYIEIHAPALREDVMRTWGNKFISFRSLMQVVH